MGLHLQAKVNPQYWDGIGECGEDYRQFDGITFVNTETGQEKTFSVEGVLPLTTGERIILERLMPTVPWNDLGDEYENQAMPTKEFTEEIFQLLVNVYKMGVLGSKIKEAKYGD